jgi:SAM-dependent methyltransferase
MRDLIPRAGGSGPGARSAIPDASQPPCAWCGSPLGEDATARSGGLACARCGVTTTYPWPSDAELDAAYAGYYRPPGGRFTGSGDKLLRRLRARLAHRLDRVAPPGRVLDVGSGDGALLEALRDRGREAVGLERAAAVSPGVEARDVTEVDGEWAAVVFWHSLEHLRQPGRALDHAAGLLAPGGVLVVALPNADSLQARVLGSRWLALDPPRHLVHVPARALTRRLRDRGLTIERTSHLRGGQVVFGWLHGLVGYLPGHLSLYDALRKPAARSAPMTPAERRRAIAAAVALMPVAAAAAGIEAALRHGGSFYVEARRGS